MMNLPRTLAMATPCATALLILQTAGLGARLDTRRQAQEPPSTQGQPPAQATPQSPAAAVRPAEVDAAIGLANGWTALAAGQTAEAAALGAKLLAQHPRNASVLTFAVEAEIGRAGSAAGLDVYERWLAGGRFEELIVVRRVALALLREVSNQPQNPTARMEALRALAADGDVAANSVLWEASKKGGYAEARALAMLGNEGSVGILIAAMNSGAMDNLEALRALGQSRSPLALPALLTQLESPKPEIRGAAAEALGHLGSAEAIAPLRTILQNDQTGYVQGRAAAALYRLGDDTGVPLIRNLATSSTLIGRIAAAEALEPRPDASWTPLVESLIGSEQADIRLRAAKLLVRVDPARAREVLEELAGSGLPAVAEAAGLEVGRAAANDVPALRRLLRSPVRLARVSAAGAILKLAR
jgi:hypothetical protein